jgi:hypothetical protein
MVELTYQILSEEYIKWPKFPGYLNEQGQTFGQYMKSKYDVSIIEEDSGLDTMKLSSPDVVFYIIYRNKFQLW